MSEKLYSTEEYQEIVNKAIRPLGKAYPDLWHRYGQTTAKDLPPGFEELDGVAWFRLTELLADLGEPAPVGLDSCLRRLAERGAHEPEAYLVAALRNAVKRFLRCQRRRDRRFAAVGDLWGSWEATDPTGDYGQGEPHRTTAPPRRSYEPRTSNLTEDRWAAIAAACVDDVDAKIVALRRQGMTWREVCEEIGLGRTVITGRFKRIRERAKRRLRMNHENLTKNSADDLSML